jgi:hypothetical protein
MTEWFFMRQWSVVGSADNRPLISQTACPVIPTKEESLQVEVRPGVLRLNKRGQAIKKKAEANTTPTQLNCPVSENRKADWYLALSEFFFAETKDDTYL